DVVGCDLMPEAARAGVNLNYELPFADVEALPIERLIDALHDVDLDEVIARADRSELVAAALLRVVRDRGRIGFVEASAGLDRAQIGFFAVAHFHRTRRAAGEDAIEVVAVKLQRAAAADAGRD